MQLCIKQVKAIAFPQKKNNNKKEYKQWMRFLTFKFNFKCSQLDKMGNFVLKEQ